MLENYAVMEGIADPAPAATAAATNASTATRPAGKRRSPARPIADVLLNAKAEWADGFRRRVLDEARAALLNPLEDSSRVDMRDPLLTRFCLHAPLAATTAAPPVAEGVVSSGAEPRHAAPSSAVEALVEALGSGSEASAAHVAEALAPFGFEPCRVSSNMQDLVRTLLAAVDTALGAQRCVAATSRSRAARCMMMIMWSDDPHCRSPPPQAAGRRRDGPPPVGGARHRSPRDHP